MDQPDAIAGAWEQALGADRPVVLEAVTDPNVPPLPPHITLKEAKNFAASVLKGDPERAGVIKQAVKGMVAALTPNHGD